jgi:hypothetical protein
VVATVDTVVQVHGTPVSVLVLGRWNVVEHGAAGLATHGTGGGNVSGPRWKDSFMATTRARGDVTSARTPIRTAALAVAVVVLLLGVLGLIPGVTTDYGNSPRPSDNSSRG